MTRLLKGTSVHIFFGVLQELLARTTDDELFQLITIMQAHTVCQPVAGVPTCDVKVRNALMALIDVAMTGLETPGRNPSLN